MEYYYVHKGKKKGPFSLPEIYKKDIKEDTLIWYEGLNDWIKANEISELKVMFKVNPPPIPPPPVPESQLTKEQKFERIAEKVLPKKSDNERKAPTSRYSFKNKSILQPPENPKIRIEKKQDDKNDVIEDNDGKKKSINYLLYLPLSIIFINVLVVLIGFYAEKDSGNRIIANGLITILFKITPIVVFVSIMKFWILRSKAKILTIIGFVLTWLLGIIFTFIIPNNLFAEIFYQDFFDAITFDKKHYTSLAVFFSIPFYVLVNLFIVKKQ